MLSIDLPPLIQQRRVSLSVSVQLAVAAAGTLVAAAKWASWAHLARSSTSSASFASTRYSLFGSLSRNGCSCLLSRKDQWCAASSQCNGQHSFIFSHCSLCECSLASRREPKSSYLSKRQKHPSDSQTRQTDGAGSIEQAMNRPCRSIDSSVPSRSAPSQVCYLAEKRNPLHFRSVSSRELFSVALDCVIELVDLEQEVGSSNQCESTSARSSARRSSMIADDDDKGSFVSLATL